MQIEPYPYRTAQDKRKTFRINREGQTQLFDVYRKAFENLWNDASLAQPATSGMGDERVMKSVLNKIGSLNVITDLEKLRAEAIRINELFNIKLKSKINDLVIDIEEERFAGKCDSKYH
jgi:hypothetical protein